MVPGCRSTSALAALALLAIGCVTAPEPEIEIRTGAIVSGTESLNDHAVVALTFRGQAFCTGTLISERFVVTAAHCLPPHVSLPPNEIDIFFGARVDGPGTLIRAASLLAHPSFDLDYVEYDIGMVELSQDAPVAPFPLTDKPFEAVTGAGGQVRMVGFGITENDGTGAGVRREGEMVVDRFGALWIELRPSPSLTCNGDSGGPLFAPDDQGGEIFAGIHTRSDCTAGSINERVDAHLDDFILPFIVARDGASCGPDLLCAAGCAALDPDCPAGACEADGVCDEDCSFDPDCGGGSGSTTGNDLRGGCQGTGGPGGEATWLSLALLVALALRRRPRLA